MEGYYWRFADPATGRAAIVLCGVCRAPDGPWAVVALAGHPGSFVRWVVAPRAWADPDGLGVAAWDEGGGELLRGAADRVSVALGADARLEASFAGRAGWPHRVFGALGPAQLAPGLPQYWHPHLLAARVSGSARLCDDELDLAGADAYAEKNWGASFPGEWWWGEAALGGGALVAFAGGRLGGALAASAIVVRVDGEVLRLAPPTALVTAQAGGGAWRLRARSARHQVLLEGEGATPHLLPVPVDGRAPRDPALRAPPRRALTRARAPRWPDPHRRGVAARGARARDAATSPPPATSRRRKTVSAAPKHGTA